jgi:hypothetical protein
MAAQQTVLLVIIIIGGLAVIGSYVFGFITQPGSENALWGGVPDWLRPFYTISMVISVLGYFAFVTFILFRIDPAQVQIAGRFDFRLFYIIFLGILIPSALWMPLTQMMTQNSGKILWIGIRLVLVLVGLSSCALVWALFTLGTREPHLHYWLAVAGSAYFAFHTAVLDMILWPALFKVPT